MTPGFNETAQSNACSPTPYATTRPLFVIDYSFSNPWLVNFNVRLFSVTVRTT